VYETVLSAMGGLNENPHIHLSQDVVAGISVAVLIVLFLVQRFGTDHVSYAFSPFILLWFLFIAGIGVFNLFKYDPTVLRAFYPKYIIDYFRRNPKTAWISLGGTLMCITGNEAMFADLGHFSVRSIQACRLCARSFNSKFF